MTLAMTNNNQSGAQFPYRGEEKGGDGWGELILTPAPLLTLSVTLSQPLTSSSFNFPVYKLRGREVAKTSAS